MLRTGTHTHAAHPSTRLLHSCVISISSQHWLCLCCHLNCSPHPCMPACLPVTSPCTLKRCSRHCMINTHMTCISACWHSHSNISVQGKACDASGEWLCWPCKVYEEEERAKGRSQAQIRPPRWEVQGGQLQEGSKAAQCALCPVRQGAFRRTADGKAWIHEVCLQAQSTAGFVAVIVFLGTRFPTVWHRVQLSGHIS